MRELQLSVTVEEANLILKGLGRLPFAKVWALVAKVQEQAREQMSGPPGSNGTAAPAAPPAQESHHAG